MSELDVKHFLGIYQLRLKMQEEGITNPSPEYKGITRLIVDKLSKLPLDEKIILENPSKGNMTMKDSKGNIIVTFPRFD